MIRRAFIRLIRLLAPLATFFLALAVVVRGTVQDRHDGFLLLYYATPWAVIAVGAAICGVYWFRRGWRFTAAWLTILSLVSFMAWLQNDWQWRVPTGQRGALRLVHWNVDRPVWRQAGVFRWLADQDADIIAIAEREPKKQSMRAEWRAAFPGYQHVTQRGETLLLVRGDILSKKREMRYNGSFATAIRVRVRGHDVTVLQVDINGTPYASRARALDRLGAIVRKHRGEDVILVGDFNTPLESPLLAPLRRELTESFEAVGSGYAATWPRPWAVLSLDQVWTSPKLRPVACEHITSWRSDHRAVITEIDFDH